MSHPRTRTRFDRSGLSAMALLGFFTTAQAQSPGQHCATIDPASERLSCYDRSFGRSSPELSPSVAAAATLPVPVPEPSELSSSEALSRLWELEPAEKRGTFRLSAYRANYILPVRLSDRPNTSPGSPADGRSVSGVLPLNATEAKFQLSSKVKVWENVLGDNGDLWLAYTQQSSWQVYNGSNSSPFRETNYEPEAIFSLRTDANILGWRWRLLNLGFVHQSNGRPLPLSRSWNRVYAQFGLERGAYSLFVRPWLRLPERSATDDNPDIRDYMGSGDVRLAYVKGGHAVSALGRYSFSGKRGAAQLDWAFPITGGLKGYLQVTHGYGESLIDYNHSQTTVGLGILLFPW